MYRLEIEPLDLGADVKAVGLELIDSETREPVRGADAASIWARALAAVAGAEPWALDFFSHLDRLRDYCKLHSIVFREAAGRCIVIPAPQHEPLAELLERFESETFGVRAGGLVISGDSALEADLAGSGVDAYHSAYPNYIFCAVCDFGNGFLTLLSNRLWTSEVIRRVSPLLREHNVQVLLPN